MSLPENLESRATQYAQSRGFQLIGRIGQGKDGTVWDTNRPSALKIHEQVQSYHHEKAAYIRLRQRRLTSLAGFAVPALIGVADELLALEMRIVLPPFIVDFASARLDLDPELIEDVGNTMEDFVRSRFDERTDEVMGIYYQLIHKAGIYLTDLHPHNIKFGD